MAALISAGTMGAEEVDLRRTGGGGDPIVIPLGLMLLALCFMSLIFHKMKQSNIVACIIIGMVVGGSGLSDSVSRELTAAFIELGIILVLFMGGLEVDVPAFFLRWKLVLVNGLGQIIINLAIFCVLGIVTGLTTEAPDTIFFGLACTLSSTILVLGGLKDRQEMETVHGQVILGLMVLQDVCAVVSLLVLSSFDPAKEGGPSFGVQIAIMLGKFAATILILVLLAKFVLRHWFKMFAVSGEMLFIGTIGYAFGVAGLAGLAHFSPEIGGFFAGVSLSSVPYRLEIEHKVEPIKAFGVVLFFFMLGIDIKMDLESLKAAVGWSLLIAILTVFVFPSIMWGLGYVCKFRSRTAFMMGLIINQISEFSLILAQLAHKYHVFSDLQFQVITFATVITLLLSSIGHVQADWLYNKFGASILARLDRRTTEEEVADDEFGMEEHVVLLGFNETGMEIAEFYRQIDQDVMVIQLDPKLHSTFRKGYVKKQIRAPFALTGAASVDNSQRRRSGEGSGWRHRAEKGVDGGGSSTSLPVLHALSTERAAAQAEGESSSCHKSGSRHGGVSVPGAWMDASEVDLEAGALRSGRPSFQIDHGKKGGTAGSLSPSDVGKFDGIKFSARASGTAADIKSNRTMLQSFKDAMSPNRGSREGMGTNIYSVYADPESPDTWEHYKLEHAKIVFSCMVGGQETEVSLSKRLKKEGVPFLAITNSNTEAKELYDSGCRYVIQQEYLAAKVVKELLDDEIPKGKLRCFDDKRREHKGELHDDDEDFLVSKIQRFL